MDSAISQNRSQQFHFIMPIIIISNAHRPASHPFVQLTQQYAAPIRCDPINAFL